MSKERPEPSAEGKLWRSRLTRKDYRPERVAEISADYLKRIFSSPDFNRTLSETIRLFQVSEGSEAGFSILKHPESDETWYSRPMSAKPENPDEVDIPKTRLALERRIERELRIMPAVIGSLHFRTDAAEVHALTPSSHKEADLEIASDMRRRNIKKLGFDIIPVEVVLTRSLDDRKEYFVIVHREPEHFQIGKKKHMLRELDTTMTYTNDQEEVLRVLKHYGYVATFFKTKEHRFSPEDLERLSDFAYVPKKV
ncbi:MAG: hypothetical protein AAB420_00885 [Patescibacteria group bacterium]